MNAFVSILVPVYNREHIIAETIVSALAQTYTNIEVVVVDNASTDKTWDVIQSFVEKDNRVKAFRNQINLGPVRNWRRCVEEASGDYGKILWSDDLIAPDFLEKTLPLFSDDVGFVFTKVEIFVDDKDDNEGFYTIGGTGIYDCNKYVNGVLFEGGYPVSPGCALFRLNDLKKNLLVDIPNKVNSDFSIHAIGNDLLIFLLTANQYKNFAFVNDKLSYFRAHEGSISVQSNDGKLPLHYNLAAAFFIENFRPDLLERFNSRIWMVIMRHRNSAKKFNLNIIGNYYLNNLHYSLDYPYIANKVFKKVVKTLF
jgi:glycosyltransferase involved in cell wall biosynthesis